MAKQLTQFSILLSSPSDLAAERDEIPHLINELNQTYGKFNDINFELRKWETDSAPGISRNYTQDLINEDLGNDYDIFLGIIWKKFGTKTQVANSGTEEEFLNALKRFKEGHNIQILFYFKNEPIPVKEIITEEIAKIQSFQENLKKNDILFWEFNNTEALKNFLRLHIPKRTDFLKSNMLNPQVVSSKVETESILNFESQEFGVLDFVIQFEDYLANANLALNGITEGTNIVGDEFKNKSGELDKVQKLPNFNRSLVVGILSRTAKSIDNYASRIKTETPIFQENFESAIKTGSLYLNGITKQNIDEHRDDLVSILEAIKHLKDNIPSAISGMSGFYDKIISLPNIYSVFTKSKKILISELDILQNTLKHSYDLTHEFEGEIEYKLRM